MDHSTQGNTCRCKAKLFAVKINHQENVLLCLQVCSHHCTAHDAPEVWVIAKVHTVRCALLCCVGAPAGQKLGSHLGENLEHANDVPVSVWTLEYCPANATCLDGCMYGISFG